MARLVADTSALVSLGTVADADPTPLEILCDTHSVVIPEQVRAELEATAQYDDAAGQAASAVLNRVDAVEIQAVVLDTSFPLDDGENAAVTLANEIDASQLLCDEFNHLAVIHASLVDTRLITTPTLLTALVRADSLSSTTAMEWLSTMSDARSWATNAYVQRARSMLQQQSE